ncbi:MAG: high-affinity branched-chain amino acid ABC transporter permease LivM [Hyphomicrobiaceae bacterium]
MAVTAARSEPAVAEANSGFGAAFADAAIAAVLAFFLAMPILAYRSVEHANSLEVVSRWPQVLAGVAAVFIGRLALNLLWPHLGSVRDGFSRLMTALGRIFTKLGGWRTVLGVLFVAAVVASATGKLADKRWLDLLVIVPLAIGAWRRSPIWLLLAFALFFPFAPGATRYYVENFGILVLIYVMLGWGLNVVVGLAGLLDLGYVAFYAVGAYAYALLAQNFGLSFWICLPLAGLLAAFWGVLLGFPVLRLRGDYLAIVTLAFGEIIRIVLINWQSLTGGPNGLSGIPRPTFFGLEFKASGGFADYFGLQHTSLHRIIFLYYIILALALITNWVTVRLRRLPVGRAWEALREDEIACRSLGINVTNTKLTAFAIGAMFGGFAGAFFATKQGFISPESFTFWESAIILAIVVLGGMGSQIGVAVAALVLVGGTELFRELEIYRMLVFGAAMVAVMVWRPRGVVSSRVPTIALGERRPIGLDLVKEGHG